MREALAPPRGRQGHCTAEPAGVAGSYSGGEEEWGTAAAVGLRWGARGMKTLEQVERLVGSLP